MVPMKTRHRHFALYRVTALATRVLKQFRRDHRTVAMLVIFPILFMLIFGIVLSGDINNVPIVVENQDKGVTNPFTNKVTVFGDTIVDGLEGHENVNIVGDNYQEGIDLVEKAEIEASILIPENFTEDLLATGNATIIVYFDGTKPQLKAAVYQAIADALGDLAEGGVQFEEHPAYGVGELSGLDVSIPAVMGYILTFLILLISVLTAIREDVSHTKTRLFTTPLTPIERILGYVIALTFLALIETIIVLTIAIYVFGATIHGSLGLLFVAGFLYGISHIFLAFLLSNFAKNEFQSVQMAVLIAIPSLALSGMILPVSTFPPSIAFISKFIPLTYGIRIFEGIMLRGWGIEQLWLEFSVILGLAVVFFILALVSSSDIRKD
ncbi:MAG: ABC transporter permease [Methanobacteriota archaeon]|nr:MAG: ABC transporter permease [Euryarchaeota archaeon]